MDEDARDVIIAWLEEPPVADPQESIDRFNQASADSLIAYLKRHGYKIVESKLFTSRRARLGPDEFDDGA